MTLCFASAPFTRASSPEYMTGTLLPRSQRAGIRKCLRLQAQRAMPLESKLEYYILINGVPNNGHPATGGCWFLMGHRGRPIEKGKSNPFKLLSDSRPAPDSRAMETARRGY